MTTLGKVRIRGVVRRGGEPVEGAYLTLNRSGSGGEEFIAERRTGPDGTYEFHTAPGEWTVICRTSGSDPATNTITSDGGELEADFDLG
ncbi:MAG: DUF1416 domain-containing protein [Actinomycetota bacterium]